MTQKENNYQIAFAGLLFGVGEFLGDDRIKKSIEGFYSNLDLDRYRDHVNKAGDLIGGRLAEDKKEPLNLLSVFSEVSLKDAEDKKPEKYYKFEEFHPDILPVQKDAEDKGDYRKLLESFSEGLNRLVNKTDNIDNLAQENIYNALCGLLEKYCWCIPYVKDEETSISLYDYCKIRSALASALYYGKEEGIEKFCFIQGDFTGIQEFIFDAGGESNKYAAKILRAKSFFVSAAVELAGMMVCKRLEIPTACIIMNAGGKFTITAPDFFDIKEKIEDIKEYINKDFHERTFGQTRFNIAALSSVDPEMLKGEKYGSILSNLAYNLECEKLRPLITEPVFKDYSIEKASNSLCQICGRRGGKKKEEIIICKYCKDYKKIGRDIVGDNADYIIFGKNTEYKVVENSGFAFDKSARLDTGRVFSLREDDKSIFAVKRISSYVPRFSEKSERDEKAYKTINEDKRDIDGKDKRESEGMIKTFYHLAADSLELEEGASSLKGSDYLGVLKADIDYLGRIFSKGFENADGSILKSFALSRMLDYFFTGWLQNKIENSSIYTVFAGGDDLFLIGAWNEIVKLAHDINRRLEEYAAGNITISAGIILSKPMVPVREMADDAEEALKKAKKGESPDKCRNRINIFGITAEWEKFDDLIKISETLTAMSDKGIDGEKLAHGFLHSLIKFSDDAGVSFEDDEKSFEQRIEAAKWRARLAYSIARNYGGKEKKALQEKLSEMKLIEKIGEYKTKMRIPLSITIYSIRR